uniref:PH domain-containing protein n=1 Tax=Onchocerca volvulus TaxID=6282 RepID=A0A8R1TSH7_ONCVO
MITIAPLDGFKGGGEGKYYAEVTLLSHPHIEASIMRTIADAMIEWRRHLLGGLCQPLDSSSVAARNLITIFDFFLSHGFNKGNRLYWLFVKEFMSRNETNYLKREWRVISVRQLSVAWLKDVLNKQTLLYYFQSFQQDLETIRKFYHRKALMANQPLLSRIVQKMKDFSEIQFKFLKPFEKYNDIPIAVMRPSLGNQRPSVSNDNLAVSSRHSRQGQNYPADHQGSRTEFSVYSQDVSSLLSDIPLPADFVETQTAAFDEDIVVPENDSDQIFGELLRRRKSESSDGIHGCLPKENEVKISVDEERNTVGYEQRKSDVSTAAVSVDPFDIALKKSLSKAKLSVEDIHYNECEHRASPITLVDLPCGEIRLDMGEMIGLSINVFKHDAERFMRLFQIYSRFGTGEIERRLFALSNQAVYLLSAENFVISKKSYVTCAYLPLRYMSSIHVGPDFQMIYLHAEKDYNICENEAGKFLSVLEICAACKQLGIVILDALKYAHKNYVSNFQSDKIKLKVYSDTPQHLIHFMSKELHKDSPILYGYYLAQWRQTNLYSLNGESYQHSGFLYHKEVGGGVSWLLGSNDFRQSYFHLQNKKLYQFSDSTCKFGERVISVRDSVTDVTELKGDERSPYMFEIVFKNSRIQFICQSAADMHKWISLITLAITSADMDDEPAACVVCLCEKSVLIAQEGLNCAVDGFMRLLARIDIACMSQATGVFAAERSACVIKNEEKLEWLFMRSPDEVDRLLGQLNQLGVKQINTEEGGSSRLSAILNSMSRLNDAFQFDDSLSDDAFDTSLEVR